jgi:hypothetical protein
MCIIFRGLLTEGTLKWGDLKHERRKLVLVRIKRKITSEEPKYDDITKTAKRMSRYVGSCRAGYGLCEDCIDLWTSLQLGIC